MYEQFFGLREAPFRPTPDPRFLYRSRDAEAALAELEAELATGRAVLLLVGDAGTGKSLLLRRLLERLRAERPTVVLLHPKVGFDEIAEHVLCELGIGTSDRRGGPAALRERLRDHAAGGAGVVLVSDEAQDADPDVLAALDETARDGALQVVLAAQPEIDATLAATSLRDRRDRWFERHLAPLTLAEVGEYVRARLLQAGAENADVFTDAALDAIAAESDGIPRIVNGLCDAALLRAFAAGSPCVTADFVGPRHTVTVEVPPVPAEPEPEPPPPSPVTIGAGLPLGAATGPTRRSRVAAPLVAAAALVVLGTQLPRLAGQIDDRPETASPEVRNGPRVPSPRPAPVVSPAASPQPPPVASPVPAPPAPRAATTVAPTPTPPPRAPDPPAASEPPAPVQEPTVGAAAPAPVEPAAVPEQPMLLVDVAKDAERVAPPPSTPGRERPSAMQPFVRILEGGGWTVQVGATKDPAVAERLAHAETGARVQSVMIAGETWQRIFVGHYGSRAEAEDAAARIRRR